jgi:hypothetical protein
MGSVLVLMSWGWLVVGVGTQADGAGQEQRAGCDERWLGVAGDGQQAGDQQHGQRVAGERDDCRNARRCDYRDWP